MQASEAAAPSDARRGIPGINSSLADASWQVRHGDSSSTLEEEAIDDDITPRETTARAHQREELAIALLRLVSAPEIGGQGPADVPREIYLDGKPISLGRSADQSDVCFSSLPKVLSRRHLTLKPTHAPSFGWALCDEGSTNGTFLNERKLAAQQDTMIRTGDVLSFGPPWATGGKLKYRFEELSSYKSEDTESEYGTGQNQDVNMDDNELTGTQALPSQSSSQTLQEDQSQTAASASSKSSLIDSHGGSSQPNIAEADSGPSLSGLSLHSPLPSHQPSKQMENPPTSSSSSSFFSSKFQCGAKSGRSSNNCGSFFAFRCSKPSSSSSSVSDAPTSNLVDAVKAEEQQKHCFSPCSLAKCLKRRWSPGDPSAAASAAANGSQRKRCTLQSHGSESTDSQASPVPPPISHHHHPHHHNPGHHRPHHEERHSNHHHNHHHHRPHHHHHHHSPQRHHHDNVSKHNHDSPHHVHPHHTPSPPTQVVKATEPEQSEQQLLVPSSEEPRAIVTTSTGTGVVTSPMNEQDCPFSSLMRMVKSHAMMLCKGADSRAAEVMAAADAACHAVTETQKELAKAVFAKQCPEAQQTFAQAIAEGAAAEVQNGTDMGKSQEAKKKLELATKSFTKQALLKCISEKAGTSNDDQTSTRKIAVMPLTDENACRTGSDKGGCSSPAPESIPSPSPDTSVKDLCGKEELSHESNEKGMTRARKSGMSELCSELVCPICQEPLFNTSTLECNHMFCEPCIGHWLGKTLNCPICRTKVHRPPTRSHPMDKIVAITLQSAGRTEALEGIDERRKEFEAELAADAERKVQLETALDKAIQRGNKFVEITRPWSAREQCRFLRGVKQYAGAPREAFCRSVALTKEFVGGASLRDLYVASANVRLGGDDKDLINQMSVAQLRDRLLMFIAFG